MDSSALAAMQKEDDIDGFIANRGASKMDFTNNYIRLYSSGGHQEPRYHASPGRVRGAVIRSKSR